MRAFRLAVLAAALAACSTTNSRIKKHQAEFDGYPPEVQQQIKNGQVQVGFTFDQVEMALGAPDRTFTDSSAGREQEIWSYGGSEPTVGVGFGYGSWGHHGGYSTGVGVASPGPSPYERARVTFENGRVVNYQRQNR